MGGVGERKRRDEMEGGGGQAEEKRGGAEGVKGGGVDLSVQAANIAVYMFLFAGRLCIFVL